MAAITVDEREKEEALNLQMEFEWVLHEEVHNILLQLHNILVECAHRFPVPLYNNEGQRQDKFVMNSQADQIRCVINLTGDSITHADISFKAQRQVHTLVHTTIQQESPWKLQQIQDAANHLQQAIGHIDNVDKHYVFRSADEVLHIVSCLLGALQRARSALVLPKKITMDELMNSRNMKSLSPNLAEDLAVSFYIQSHKLVFVTYQLSSNHGSMKIDSNHTDCSVPWLNEILWLLTSALQICQQLKDKICVFSQYKDFTVDSHNPAVTFY